MNNFKRFISKKPEAVGLKQQPLFSKRSNWSLIIAFLLVFVLAFAPPTSAQLVGFPVGPSQSTSLQKNVRTSLVSLPFFDDFSLVTNGRLDPSLWQTGGGTYVSNTITINHPTLNVVTFDGSDRAGRPYNFVTQSAQGMGDTLTSQAIDLSGLALADSVYFSFYWQLKGLGEFPDADDSLRVQFLTDKGIWQTVWKQVGGKQDNNFNYSQLVLRDLSYLHANFQFRFQAFNRLSGQFDMWHIDYVYLNRGRRAADRFVRDVSCRLPVSSFLKRYTAMPLKQYLARPAAETADSVTTDIRNLFNVFNFTTFAYTLRDEISGSTFQNFQQSSSELISSLSQQSKSLKPAAITALDTTKVKKLSLVSRFAILTTDNVNPSIPSIDLRRNDSISGKTILDDYYAYDDGTAETAVYFNRSLGRTAVRYFLNTPDLVSGVRMNIVSTLKDLTGQSITNYLGQSGTYSAQPNNVRDFFRNGSSLNNAISVTGGTDKMQTYVSYTNNRIGGIIDKNDLFRNTINLRITNQISKRFSTDAKITYVNQRINSRPRSGEENAPVSNIYNVARNMTTADLMQYEKLNNVGIPEPTTFPSTLSSIYQNPYWMIHNYINNEARDRVIGFLTAKYKLTDWLTLSGKANLDKTTDNGETSIYQGTILYSRSGGDYSRSTINVTEKWFDLMLDGNNKITDNLSINYRVGGIFQDSQYDGNTQSAGGLNVTNKFSLNFAQNPSVSSSFTRVQTQSVFAQANLALKESVFLDLSLRNDWDSRLPSPYTYQYPSVGVSAILSDMIKLPAAISFLKASGNYAQVGNGGQFGLLKSTYSYSPGAGNGFLARGTTLPFPTLKPEIVKSIEFGIDARFVKNRIGFTRADWAIEPMSFCRMYCQKGITPR